MSLQLKTAASILIVAGLASLFAPVRAAGAIAGAENPKAYTQHDYYRTMLDFNRRTLAGAYQTLGKRDPKWDAAALKLLDAMAIRFTYGPAESIYRTVELPTGEQIEAMTKAVTDFGCDDPLVIYCVGAVLDDMGKKEQALPLVEKSVEGLTARKYPSFRINGAAERMTRLLDPKKDAAQIERYGKIAWDSAIESAVAQKVEIRDLRFMLVSIDRAFDRVKADGKGAFCKSVEAAPMANPWLLNLLKGRYEVAAAWEARGSGWANTVTDQGWKDFFDHLNKARDYLTKAHALHPEFPEAASQMIAVAMGGNGRFPEKEREWFDKATQAQLDFFQAYDFYVWSIYPRWGGSHRAMFQFGLECLQTGRYDTYIPYQLIRIVEKIDEDSTRDFSIFAAPPVYAAVRQMLTEANLKAPKQDVDKDFYLSYLAAIQWRTHRYDDAAEVLDKLAERLDMEAFNRVRAWPAGAVSQIRAMATRHGKALEKAEAQANNGQYDPAIAAYADAASKLPKDHPGQLFLHYRAKTLQIQKDFADGKWVSLKADQDFAPWEVVTGNWKMDKDGSFVATSDDWGGAELVCRNDFGPFYQIKAKIEFPDLDHPGLASILFRWRDARLYRAAGINLTTHSVTSVALPKSLEQPVPLIGPVNGSDELEVQVHGQTHDVLLNGKRIFTNRPNQGTPEQDVYVGIGLGGTTPHRTARFKDVQIHKLDPAAAKQEP
jgi:tetratricopeptide (TPR) repeat protein